MFDVKAEMLEAEKSIVRADCARALFQEHLAKLYERLAVNCDDRAALLEEINQMHARLDQARKDMLSRGRLYNWPKH